jgi:PRC-barrel domain
MPLQRTQIENYSDICLDWPWGAKTTMLTNTAHLKGFVIRATDGELGIVDQIYFDDETWAIRYLIVETGGWLSGRRVLISPISVVHTDLQGKRVDVALTKQQVENSPDIDTRKPVSRQHEAEYLGYFGYPFYWSGPYLWGPEFYPGSLILPTTATKASGVADKVRGESADSHLRSTEAVTGYHIEATDGEIGHVDGFAVDDEVWAIRYIEVATRNWWPGKRVLVSPAWIERVSWTDSKVYVGLSRDAIQNAPEYVESMPISREYENGLYFHYGRPPYWLHEAEHKSPFPISGV